MGTVFDPESPLIKREAVHHDSYDGGHGQHAIFPSVEEAKNAIDDDPHVYVDPIPLYYDLFPNMVGHVVVTRNRRIIGGQIKE